MDVADSEVGLVCSYRTVALENDLRCNEPSLDPWSWQKGTRSHGWRAAEQQLTASMKSELRATRPASIHLLLSNAPAWMKQEQQELCAVPAAVALSISCVTVTTVQLQALQTYVVGDFGVDVCKFCTSMVSAPKPAQMRLTFQSSIIVLKVQAAPSVNDLALCSMAFISPTFLAGAVA